MGHHQGFDLGSPHLLGQVENIGAPDQADAAKRAAVGIEACAGILMDSQHPATCCEVGFNADPDRPKFWISTLCQRLNNAEGVMTCR